MSSVRKFVKSAAKSVILLQDRILMRLAQGNYHTARSYYHYKLARMDLLAKQSPILVHQMGKVGSSSVTASLKQAQIGRTIYHTHYFNPDYLAEIERKLRHYFYTDDKGKLRHIWQAQYLQKKFRERKDDKKWRIVTLTREPIARNISDFFTHIEVIPGLPGKTSRIISGEYSFDMMIDTDLSELIYLFFTKFPHERSLTYFDTEFKDFLGIDLYSGTFPIAKGFRIHEGQRAKVLLIRMENLSQCAAEAFREFLGIENLQLVRRNVASQKGYAELYQQFKESIVFPESYVDKMYESKYSQTFYNEAEIEQFRRQWLGMQSDN